VRFSAWAAAGFRINGEDLANVFALLTSDGSHMINGQLLQIDGELLSKMPYFEAYGDASAAA